MENRNERLKLEPLKRGDIIGVVSPSSPISPGAIDANIHFLKEMGFQLKFGTHINDSHRFLAGSDDDRAQDLMDFFKDPKINCIIATRGGQGSQRLLPLLDYELIAKNPKPFIGFSDTTALQLGLLKKTGLSSYSGFTLTTPLNSSIKKTLMCCLFNKPYSVTASQTVNKGVVDGELIGVNYHY